MKLDQRLRDKLYGRPSAVAPGGPPGTVKSFAPGTGRAAPGGGAVKLDERLRDTLYGRPSAVAPGCRPGTVKSLLHRGLAELRQVVER